MIDIWCARCRVVKLGWRDPAVDRTGVTIPCPGCGFQHNVDYKPNDLDSEPRKPSELRLTTA